jgi:hypothetical protein
MARLFATEFDAEALTDLDTEFGWDVFFMRANSDKRIPVRALIEWPPAVFDTATGRSGRHPGTVKLLEQTGFSFDDVSTLDRLKIEDEVYVISTVGKPSVGLLPCQVTRVETDRQTKSRTVS